MQESQLKPANFFAQNYGVKMICYGGPGTGKTPIVNTAPRPVLLAVEPGLLSMRESTVPTWGGFTIALFEEFFKWFFTSAESKNYDTLCIDSMSQIAEVYLQHYLIKEKHGLKAYGLMAEAVNKIARDLYYFPQKHIYMIAQEGIEEVGDIKRYRPMFPGKDLNKTIPHLYDVIARLEKFQSPASPKPVVGIRTLESFSAMARDRTGKLAEIEPANLAALFTKAMS